MKIELLKEIIKESQTKVLPSIIERNIHVPIDTNKIISLVGARRSGKTFVLYSIIQKLKACGIPEEQILYINFDDPRWMNATVMDLELIWQAYQELYPGSTSPKKYFFLDEIQNIPEWEIGIRRLHDTMNIQLFLTGSSSKLLSSDISTHLRGRSVSFFVSPFSFPEFLLAKNQEIDSHSIYSEARFKIMNYLEEYFTLGGFPEVVLEPNQDMKLMILREYFDTMFLRDLLERFDIRNKELLKALIQFLSTITANQFSVNSFFQWIKTIHPATKNTIFQYISYLEEIGLFYFVKKFSFSVKEQSLTSRKCYILDNGLKTALGFHFSDNKGSILENTVYLDLLKRRAKEPNLEIYYWKDGKEKEIDFVLFKNRKIEELIQVCTDLTNPKTVTREINALLSGSNKLSCDNLTILTLTEEEELLREGKTIQVKPIWKWLVK
jgi:predicted AAA+ superfamily ATPase